MNNTNENANPVTPPHSNQDSGGQPHQTSTTGSAPVQPPYPYASQGVPSPQHHPQPTQSPQNPVPPVNSAYPAQGTPVGYHASAAPNAQQQYAQPKHQHQPQPPSQQGYVQSSAQTTSEPKKSGGFKTFGLAFLGAALALVIGLGGYSLFAPSSSNDGQHATTVLGSTESSTISVDEDSTLAETVADKALPSVVNIDVYTAASNYGFGFGADSSGTLQESSLGSGVILSEDGYIITNYHVIEGADALEVTVGDTTYEATIVGSDPSSDLAVIKAEGATDLTPIEIGSSSDLVIGEWVMTIGSPFGLEQSVATGIVSATSRSQILESTTGGATTIYANLIQTDAAINPGNSGGALVDSDGKLIGINTLITSYSGNYSGVGFAIPVDYALNIAEQIINGETPSHAQLGVSLSTVNSAIAERYGLSVDTGAYVTQVHAGSGAAEAGLQEGDIITKFDGQAVASASDLMLEIRSKNPGDTVTVEFNRRGETKTTEITLGSDAGALKQSSSSNYGRSEGTANVAA